LFSGFLTLYVVPAVYTFLSRKRAHRPEPHPDGEALAVAAEE
jgi:hypothetical protein